MPQAVRSLLYFLTITVALSAVAATEKNPERFQTNRDIQVAAGEKLGDVSCLNCSIHVRGTVAGDAFALNGNIVIIEEGGQVSGDLSTLLGDVRLENGSQVSGDVAAIGGLVRRQPQAMVGGDVASMGGGWWILLIFLVPLALLGGFIALIIWLVQRNRRPAAVPA